MARRFYRIDHDRKIAGVCTGLAEYFNIDVTLIRAIFVVLAIGGGSAILVYLILWAITPSRAHGSRAGAEPPAAGS